jgi:biotin carboxyl carrier protein
MKFLVDVDGRSGELTASGLNGECRFVYRGACGETIEAIASMQEVEPGIYSVLLNGRSYEPKVAAGPRGLYVDLDGERSVVDVRDPREMSARSGPSASDGRQQICAPMPGKVIRVLVGEGDEVAAGAGLVVVEAMKMQNEMKSPKSGRVLFVKAKEGDTVTAGEVLVTVE